MSFPRAAVDSIRIGNPTGGFFRSAAIGAGIVLGVTFVACASAGGCYSGN